MAIGKKITAICTTIIIAQVCTFTYGYSHAKEIQDPGATATSKSANPLQQLIQNAQSGATLLISAGTYKGPIRIDKPVRLIAKGDVTIDGGGHGDVVTLAVNGIELRGFTIVHSGRELENDQSGIKLLSSNNVIAGNTIEDCLHGIYLKESSNNQIVNNRIKGISSLDINDRGNGIHFFHSPSNEIDDNSISFTRDGMYFSYSSHNHVMRNQVHDVRYGLHYMYSNDNRFEWNTFSHNVGGSALMYSHGIVLKHNTFSENRGQKGTGIVFNTCDDSLIENNKIFNNLRAFFMDSSSRNTIRNNDIVNNFIGMEIPSSSSDNKIYGNNWISNDVPVITDHNSKSNEWYNSETKKGNYWSHAELLDFNHDGVSDMPYHPTTVQSYLIGQYPDLRFLENSPAMKLLDFAYQQFPVFKIPSPVDPYPLIAPFDWRNKT
ncbi:nitrous oxide reductase family maturation protein NosD [Fodinisporobacter ferrooxydans]|uniref:Nitrous oxide reductase family maturation protein NosD n=1 Tax=Fodinisporobacter ferrooxydans TaxID=2901836 RepID=A0ABY4CRL1_9BACL|nr:nitrous oxide reductase family maturation protein NosD [Alicyclobacillaceae bacterium MYW30-H2]